MKQGIHVLCVLYGNFWQQARIDRIYNSGTQSYFYEFRNRFYYFKGICMPRTYF